MAAEETDEARPYCGVTLPLVRNQQFPVQLLGCGSMSVPFQKDFRMPCGGKLEVSGGHCCVNEAMGSRVYRASRVGKVRRFRGLLTTVDWSLLEDAVVGANFWMIARTSPITSP